MNKRILLWVLAGLITGCGGDPKKKETSPGHDAGTEEVTVVGYRKVGMDYAMAVQGTLGKTLQGKMQQEGPVEAIAFCNVKALPITDSIARSLGASISRITDQPRNPANRANAEEMRFISNFRAELSTGMAPQPFIVRQDNRTCFYYPILTNNLCLQCHGKPGQDIAPEVYTRLQELYPEDEAIDYSANQLRGLWKVAFNE